MGIVYAGTIFKSGDTADVDNVDAEPDEEIDTELGEMLKRPGDLRSDLADVPYPAGTETQTTTTKKGKPNMAPPKKLYTLKRIAELAKINYPSVARMNAIGRVTPEMLDGLVFGEGKMRKYSMGAVDVYKAAYAAQPKGKGGRRLGSGRKAAAGSGGDSGDVEIKPWKKPGQKPGRKPGRPPASAIEDGYPTSTLHKPFTANRAGGATLVSRIESLEESIDLLDELRTDFEQLKQSLGL